MSTPNVSYSFDDEVASHTPDLYHYAAIAETIDGLDNVGDKQIKRYQEQGFIAVRNAFTLREVQDALDGLSDLIAGKATDFQNIQFQVDVRDRLEMLGPEERLDSVRRLLYFTDYEPRLKSMALNLKLTSVVERLLGAPSEMFQSMALIKPPRGREKPWHQDHAYFELPQHTRVVGVWIALDPAGTENGCMRVLPGWHRKGKFTHFQIRDWQICDSEMSGLIPERVAVPLDPGGCLIFDSYLPHGTPSNLTRTRRRAVQFHYCPAGTQKITPEERLAVFGSEGKNVIC
jgi:phytanoyl-CoA hydroxylase